MIDFSTIATDLQITIAEKMIYHDQKEFELSSKHGKEIVKRIRHKAVVVVEDINMHERDLRFRFKFVKYMYHDVYFRFYPYFKEKLIEWSKIRHCPDLPRILLRKFTIENVQTLDLLIEVRNKLSFLDDKVHLNWKYTRPNITPILDVISGIINIRKFTAAGAFDPELLTHSALQELDATDIGVDLIPTEALLKLKSPFLVFREFSDPFRINLVANLLFQEWFFEEREIHVFHMYPSRNTGLSVVQRREILFNGIPYSTVLQNEETEPRDFRILKSIGIQGPVTLYKGDGFYSIDNGSKKLLVFQSNELDYVLAFEYGNIEDAVKFDEF